VKGSRKVGGNEKEATCEINFRRSSESMARECNRLIKLSSALAYRQFHLQQDFLHISKSNISIVKKYRSRFFCNFTWMSGAEIMFSPVSSYPPSKTRARRDQMSVSLPENNTLLARSSSSSTPLVRSLGRLRCLRMNLSGAGKIKLFAVPRLHSLPLLLYDSTAVGAARASTQKVRQAVCVLEKEGEIKQSLAPAPNVCCR
jgi:hypothetical protein